MNEQRRRYCRIAFDSPAQLIIGDVQIEVRVGDISLKGALVRLPEGADLRPGVAAELRVDLNEVDNQISMQTLIVHVEDQQAGLVCRTIDLDSASHLRRLVELNLGSAELLEREFSVLLSG
ncbi:PilZ domain-containing protein [Accumulibacter sp.]|uniref:PilZ domain-containing protein n=1 Tax=Accumulibacter sp. TaxID=2053492 RepID=UPI0028C483ED|nr:PilZ domain-containing protein [Accumulibacter sp.]